MPDKLLYYLTPIGRLLLFMLFIVIALMPVALLIQVPAVTNLFHLMQPVHQDIIQEVIFIVVILTALAMLSKILLQYHRQQLFCRSEALRSGLLKGTAIGVSLMVVCAAIIYVSGYVQFQYNGIVPQYFFSLFLLFLVVAIFEEVLFRTFPLIVFAERYPLIITIILNGLLFATAHLANPNFTALSFINITLAGCLFSLFVLVKWNISWAIGIHLGWNFTQGALLGYRVSGLATKGVLIAKPIGNAYFSGGNFGVEGSIFCTILLLILIIALFFKYRLHPLAIAEENQIEEVNELS